ncbi:hypothetical protein AAC387_Pa02g5126 [Persea americana]
MGSQEEERLLADEEVAFETCSLGPYIEDGSVDIKGKRVLWHNTGNWRACPFILGNECCERLAYYGISTNLVTYLTNILHQGNVSTARNVTTWEGTCYITPLIGAVLADACLDKAATVTDLDVKMDVSMFVEQGMVLDTSLGSVTIPPASLSTFDVVSVIAWVPMYGAILIPIGRKFTGKPRAFSELQRMGIGLFISILSMVAAAVVEIRRLDIAKELDLTHTKAAVPAEHFLADSTVFSGGCCRSFHLHRAA